MAKVQIKEYYQQQKGTANGLPFVFFNVNIMPQDFLQQQCEEFTDFYALPIVANDYNSNPVRGPLQTNVVHDMFQVPFLKPVFLVINCITNSTHQPYLQLQYNETNRPNVDIVARWREAIDGVMAPAPRLADVRLLTDGAFRFSFLGQRGRTNRVECSTDFVDWTVLTNFFGTNAPSVFQEPAAIPGPPRFYRVRRL